MNPTSLFIDEHFRKHRFWLAIFLYMAVLVFGSIPGARGEVGEYATGLVLHFVTYAAIAFLLFTGFQGESAFKGTRTVILIAMMGALDEYVQSFLPYRRAAIGDWSVDASAGIVMSALLSAILPVIRRRVAAP
ncbi:VanZ family protein [Noviherbaspirillum saxi]|uniref:VanZ like family protein n=1 Tax=Noviherbaspirillum saxi TaxID=2320863 RepID=A0A3A3FKL3_9BURK|nr:VanZ family protein [Noviherbaspirillum saxi]RJF96068.1 hypothetical protein D3871_22270 [Noviherbaspirillum saxi]